MSGVVKQAVEKYNGRVISWTCIREVKVGDIIPLGSSMVGVTIQSGNLGEMINVEIEKVWTINAATADAIAMGDVVYWDDTNKVITTNDTGNTWAGRAMSSKSAGVAGTVDVKINV